MYSTNIIHQGNYSESKDSERTEIKSYDSTPVMDDFIQKAILVI